MELTKIVLADDHALIRHGIRRIIEEKASLQVIGEAGDGLELLEVLKRSTPHMIVLDISMPNMRGLEAIKAIKKLCPKVKILILTMHKNDQLLCSAISAGANGYLLKEDSDTELLPAIATVLQGQVYVSPCLSRDFAENLEQICRKSQHPPLTSREKQILQRVVEGETSKEIAELLGISKRTVEHHRANLTKKLKIKSTAALTKFAIREGYGGRQKE